MSKRDATILLDDISTAIGRIQRHVAGLDRDAFLADDKTVDTRKSEVRGLRSVLHRRAAGVHVSASTRQPVPVCAGRNLRVECAPRRVS